MEWAAAIRDPVLGLLIADAVGAWSRMRSGGTCS
jgi:hypothetical protein